MYAKYLGFILLMGCSSEIQVIVRPSAELTAAELDEEYGLFVSSTPLASSAYGPSLIVRSVNELIENGGLDLNFGYGDPRPEEVDVRVWVDVDGDELEEYETTFNSNPSMAAAELSPDDDDPTQDHRSRLGTSSNPVSLEIELPGDWLE